MLRFCSNDDTHLRENSDMAKAQYDHLWPLAHAERAALAADLSDLDAVQWQHDTLCEGWNVEEVVAHLTATASLNQWRWLRSMLAARFRPAVQISEQDIQRYYREHFIQGKAPLNEVRSAIEQKLTNERADAELDQWLKQQRRRTGIEYLEKDLAP